MKNFILCMLFVVALSCPAWANISGDEYVEGDVIVMVEASDESTARVLADDLASKFQLEVRDVLIFGDKGIIFLRSENKSTAELTQELSSVPYVLSAEPNYIRYEHNPDGSGSGCNVGYGCLSMFMLVHVFLAVFRRKR